MKGPAAAISPTPQWASVRRDTRAVNRVGYRFVHVLLVVRKTDRYIVNSEKNDVGRLPVLRYNPGVIPHQG